MDFYSDIGLIFEIAASLQSPSITWLLVQSVRCSVLPALVLLKVLAVHCCWFLFVDENNAGSLLGSLDLAYLFAYAVGMFFRYSIFTFHDIVGLLLTNNHCLKCYYYDSVKWYTCIYLYTCIKQYMYLYHFKVSDKHVGVFERKI